MFFFFLKKKLVAIWRFFKYYRLSHSIIFLFTKRWKDLIYVAIFATFSIQIMLSSAAPSISFPFHNHNRNGNGNGNHHHNYGIAPPRFVIRCAIASASSPKKNKLWKQGEHPGRVSENSSNRRTPIKNIKKKLDRKANLNPWVNTVTEALSESVDVKQWSRALQVIISFNLMDFISRIRTDY